MPSPRARHHAIKDPDGAPLKPTLPMRFESALLMALCIFLGFVLPLLLRSKFDGVWFRTSGDQNALGEIKLLVHNGKFAEVIPLDCFGSYPTVPLIADGREHPWSEPAGMCGVPAEPGI